MVHTISAPSLQVELSRVLYRGMELAVCIEEWCRSTKLPCWYKCHVLKTDFLSIKDNDLLRLTFISLFMLRITLSLPLYGNIILMQCMLPSVIVFWVLYPRLNAERYLQLCVSPQSECSGVFRVITLSYVGGSYQISLVLVHNCWGQHDSITSPSARTSAGVLHMSYNFRAYVYVLFLSPPG